MRSLSDYINESLNKEPNLTNEVVSNEIVQSSEETETSVETQVNEN